MKNKLKTVLDTNVLLVSVSDRSKYHWIYRSLIDNVYDLFITNDILSEYEEIISTKFSPDAANAVVRTLLELSNVYQTTIYFNLDLIPADPDDNKFADCAFACNADVLVTQDRDFDILKSLEFPSIQIVNIEEFKKLLENAGE